MSKGNVDERVDKRKVTMRNLFARTVNGKHQVEVQEAVDYVRPDFLDAYLADARTRWQEVEVSAEPDAGPAGYDGDTTIPEQIAGKTPQALAAYGDATTLENPLDELLEQREPGRSGNQAYARQPGGGGAGRLSGFLPRLALFLNLALMLAVVLTMLRAAIQTQTMRHTLVDAYRGAATHGAVYTTAPGGAAGTEPSGGSPAYARKALTWSAASSSATTATATFDIPSGATIVGAGIHTALTAGTYLDGTSVTSQAFASQGTYTVTFQYTQT